MVCLQVLVLPVASVTVQVSSVPSLEKEVGQSVVNDLIEQLSFVVTFAVISVLLVAVMAASHLPASANKV